MLKPYPAYKPSGVEWLGDVPQHWGVKRLKYLGQSLTGLTYAPNDIVSLPDDGTLVLRSSNVQNGNLSFDDNVYVTTRIPQTLRARPGDILICSRNGSRALIGKNALLQEVHGGLTWGAFMTVYRTP